MGKSRDENTQDEFPDIEPESALGSSQDFEVVAGGLTEDHAGSTNRKIGRYRLLHPIGEGGMGVVWRAIQEHPVKRDVALKLVRKDVGKDALARFDGERQAIAMMDHPNIAKILDADTTKDGAPYFVMELVKGIPLDQYCNNRKLGIEERLRLMLPVCRAVQHAHQKAIIHRDLKHSNILVAENDDEPIPKVIDFGLAKALGSQKLLTDKTVYTEFGKVVGTIYYMSPEQAESGGLDIDTRSDIFSLGVVMYKLLTGRTPIQMEGDALSVIGAIKIIQEKDPIAPSLAIRNFPDCANWVTESTHATPERFAEQLKGDLDSIILKALEKDRRSRYETANGLAMDIERYLNHEPVLAQPRSTVYSIKKFVQRNRGLVASLATIMSLLVLGIVATTLALGYALSETERAKKAEKLKTVQLKSQWMRSSANDWKVGNSQSAWQTLRQIKASDRSWTSRFLANEMDTCRPSDSLHGHAHYVLTVDVAPQGNLILSGGSDDTVYLWDSETNQKIYRKVLKDIVVRVRFSVDQKLFAVADRSNMVTLFDTETGKTIREFGPFQQDVNAVAFHPTRPVLALGFYDNDSMRVGNRREAKFNSSQPADLRIVNFESGKHIQTIEAHLKEITSLEFNDSGDRLVTGCMDGNLRIWKNVAPDSELKFELAKTINANPGGIYSVDFSPDGKMIVSGGKDNAANVFDTESGELVTRLPGHSATVLGVDFSPSGKLIATVSNDQQAVVWDLEGKKLATWKGHAGPINEVSFTADSKEIVTASDDQTLRRWEVDRPGKTVICMYDKKHELWSADFSPDNRTVATVGENGMVCLIDAKTGRFMKKLSHDLAALSVAWLSNGQLVTGGESEKLLVWDRLDRDKAVLKPTRSIEVNAGLIWDISTSPDESLLITANSDSTASIFDSSTRRKVHVLRGHSQGLASARYSNDGKYIATASDDHTVKIWDASSYQLLTTLEGHHQPVWRAVFSPIDSSLIASSAADGKVLLWDWKNESNAMVTYEGHTSQVAGLTFTPDGRCLVSASDDGTVRVWDVETGVELFVFQEQPAAAMIHVSFSRDGQSLVTTSQGKTVIRHASPNFTTPFLRRDAIQDSIGSEVRVRAEDTSESELKQLLEIAKRASEFYPSYTSLTNQGIAQYRLGEYADAASTLEEAMRVERITYGLPDIRPWIEGYLALSYVNSGDLLKAKEMRQNFDLKAEDWVEDAQVTSLQSKVRAAIEN